MLLGHAVDVVAEIEGEIGHIQFAFTAENFMHFQNVASTHNASHQLVRKFVMPGRYRSVSSENASMPNGLHVSVVDSVTTKLGRTFVEQLQAK